MRTTPFRLARPIALGVIVAALIGTAPVAAFADPAKDAKASTESKSADAKPTDGAKTGETKSTDATTTDGKTTDAKAADTKSGETKSAAAADKKKPTRAQLEAMLSKCSDEADAKGLSVTKGKGAARKAFRRECMHKMGVDPR